MISLVAFDLDGTLIGRDLKISPGVRDAVARMLAAGVAGCIVTGRMYRATLPFA
ncbi:MAG: HAD family phosphatase, partial [Candidatus Eremiobacteraeota bacterium]|nr:HAD family phosphatase [Candidatus Eremiobacteraeota bacterium]